MSRFTRLALLGHCPTVGSPFAVAIALGAFLLFQVQFTVGKQILPWFGGAPAVWTTCMLFFQVSLLAGYGYAHALSRQPPRRQRNVHLAMLGVVLALLAWRWLAWPSPLTPGESWKPGPEDQPVAKILKLLFLGAGLPYLIVATTGPLIQSWFSRTFPYRSPYRLFALSNLGSLLGLLSYPFLIEPLLDLPAQGRLWAVGFAVYAVACTACAIAAARSPLIAPVPATDAHASPDRAPTLSQRILWLSLAAVASVMLLAVTNQLCMEVAVIPFLWILPLALYLLSFVLTFEYDWFYQRSVWATLLVLSAGASTYALFNGPDLGIAMQVSILSVALLSYCMVCHGELARRKPSPRHLTSFYLLVSAGGAVGGLFTGIVAPAVFPAYWEIHVALAAGVVLLVVLLLRDRNSWSMPQTPLRTTAYVVLPTAAIALVGCLVWQAQDSVDGATHLSRNFFGVLRVSVTDPDDVNGYTKLLHGRIAHGLQPLDPKQKRKPTTYYGLQSGIGLILANHPNRFNGDGHLRVGLVGLGTGTLAAYARPGDAFTVYEINPEVLALSAGPTPVFTYLKDAPTPLTTILGDGRLTLERQPAQHFDVLALDAFSSDSIPVHLLTREAMAVYLRHLRKPDGVLAIHISNRYLYLQPVVRGLAEAYGLTTALVDADSDDDMVWSATWVLLSRSPAALQAPVVVAATKKLDAENRGAQLWTDAYSNLLRVLK